MCGECIAMLIRTRSWYRTPVPLNPISALFSEIPILDGMVVIGLISHFTIRGRTEKGILDRACERHFQLLCMKNVE